jgi:hypothetical protein
LLISNAYEQQTERQGIVALTFLFIDRVPIQHISTFDTLKKLILFGSVEQKERPSTKVGRQGAWLG